MDLPKLDEILKTIPSINDKEVNVQGYNKNYHKC